MLPASSLISVPLASSEQCHRWSRAELTVDPRWSSIGDLDLGPKPESEATGANQSGSQKSLMGEILLVLEHYLLLPLAA